MLTINHIRDYSIAQVLNTPPQADRPAPDSRGFFASIVCLWSGSVQYIQDPQGKDCGPSCGGVQVPGHPSEQGVNIEQNRKEATMAIKSKVTSSERKKSSTKSKVLHLDPLRIKESDGRKWAKRFLEFLESLSETELEVAQKVVNLISHRPSKRKQPCEVIQFAKGVQS